MKNWKKFALALGVLVSITACKTTSAEAKDLPLNKVYEVDLNGDGKKEAVKFTSESTENPYCTTAKLFVNDKKVYSKKVENALCARVSVVDFDSKDKKKDIYVQYTTDSDCFLKADSWQYNGEKLTKRFQIDGKDLDSFRVGLQAKQPGDGKVYLEEEYADTYLGQGYIQAAYTIKSKTLKPVNGKTFNVTANWKKRKYTSTKTLPVYDSISASTKKDTVKKGEVFYIHKINFKKENAPTAGISYIYVKTKKGKSGWIKVPKYAIAKEIYAWG